MSESLKDILSHLQPGIDQETLLLYLQDKLSEEQRHEVEKGMLDSDFDADALEGLEQFSNKKEIALLVDHLNRDLKKRTEKKKRLRQKLNLRIEPWLLIAIVTILLIAILGFIIVRAKMKH